MNKEINRKVWRTSKAGNIGRLALQEESLAPLEPDKIRVETHAIGLNFADIFALAGLYSPTPKGSFIPGLEFSGTVVAVGENVNKLAAGDEVMGVTHAFLPSWISVTK